MGENGTKDMYILSLHAKEIRGFQSVEVKFNNKFNFIVGPNGAGKTSILRLIALCMTSGYISDSRYGDKSEVWINSEVNGGKFRIGLGAGWVKSYTYRDARVESYVYPPTTEGYKALVPFVISKELPEVAPLFIGAHRKFDYVLISGMAREGDVSDRREYYRGHGPVLLNGSVLPNTKQWLINRYFSIDKDWANIERNNWNLILERLGKVGPKGSEFKFKEIRSDLEPKFYLRGKECFLEELSAGFQSVLSLIFAIVEWIEGTNEDDMKKIDNAVGTVIIDELDVHLHPEWQLTIRETLESFFPNIQFIITTHSPHLIATAKSGEIIILPENNGVIDVAPVDRSFSGWTTDQILEEIMQVKSLENKIYERLVHEAMDYVEQKDTHSLERVIQELCRVTHPNDTIVSVLQIKLASLSLED